MKEVFTLFAQSIIMIKNWLNNQQTLVADFRQMVLQKHLLEFLSNLTNIYI